MRPENLTKADMLALKAATRKLTQNNGGVVDAGELVGVSHGHIAKCGNINNDERYLTLPAVAALEKECGEPSVTRVLAGMAGHFLISKPPADAGGRVATILGTAGVEFGQMSKGLCDAIADDGKVSPAEIRENGLIKNAEDVAEVAMKIVACLKQIEAEEDGGAE